MPEHKGCCRMGDGSSPGSQHLLSQFSPKASVLKSLLTCHHPFCPYLCQSPGKVAANENLCVGPLIVSATLPLLVIICVLFGLWSSRLGNPSLGFRPHSSQGDSTGYLIIPLALLPVVAQPVLSSLYHTPYHIGCT